MKLKNKIHLYTSALFAALLIVLNVTIYFFFSSMTLSGELNSVKDGAENMLQRLRPLESAFPAVDLLRAVVPANGMIRIVGQTGEPIITVTSTDEHELRNTEVSFYSEERKKIVKHMDRSLAFVSIPMIWNSGEIVNFQVMESMAQIDQNLSTLRNVLMIVTLIAMIPVILSGRLLSNLITRPITTMIRTMKDIRESGQLKRINLENRSNDELAQMGETFNHMVDLLQTNFDKQELFVSNASHELKTPLTVIESYASLLKRRGTNDPELLEESIEAIHSEAVRMKALTEQLLLLAKRDEDWDVHIERIHLNQLTIQVVKAFRNAYDVSVDEYLDFDVEGYADEQKLKQLLFIFLDNARKYSDGPITVRAGKVSDKAFIEIEDQGIGIPEADLEKVFDRFYRVDQARTRKGGGFGLGLTLAKELADASEIKIDLKSKEGVGTTVTLYIPLADF